MNFILCENQSYVALVTNTKNLESLIIICFASMIHVSLISAPVKGTLFKNKLIAKLCFVQVISNGLDATHIQEKL